MQNHNLSEDQFSDFINLANGVYKPLKNFVNKDDLLEILKKNTIKNKFYPFPILLGIKRSSYIKIQNNNKLIIKFRKNNIAKIKNLSFFSIDKIFFGKKLFGSNYKYHPYFKKINKYYKFMNFEIINIFEKNLKHKYFISPKKFKKKYSINKLKHLSSFHTRNVPHAGHQWIHNYMIKKYKNLLIQPLLGQYQKGEYRDKTIILANKLASKVYNKIGYKTLFATYFSYPRYGGPREAALHAIVRKNYGCTHFWVGRDHAGYKKYFKKYESQEFCKQNEKNIGINIIAEKEPIICMSCKKISNKKCNKNICNKSYQKQINGAEIRKMIKRKKKIPNYLMGDLFSKNLNNKTIL